MICREDYSFWYLSTEQQRGRAHRELKGHKVNGGANFEGHLFFHTAWSPISERSCGFVPLKRDRSFEFPISAGNRLKDKASLFWRTLDLTWHTPHRGYRIVICYGLLWFRTGECLTETTTRVFSNVVVSSSLKNRHENIYQGYNLRMDNMDILL